MVFETQLETVNLDYNHHLKSPARAELGPAQPQLVESSSGFWNIDGAVFFRVISMYAKI